MYRFCVLTAVLLLATMPVVAQTQPERLFLPSLSAQYLPAYAGVAARGQAEIGTQCDWEAGVLAIGWIRAWLETGNADALAWTESWTDRCVATAGAPQHVNDGLLGYPAIFLERVDPTPTRRAYAQRVADWLLTTANRNVNGAFTHGGDTVWDDTLISTVPFLLEMSRATGNNAYRDEAIEQLARHQLLLQDPTTGLYRHAWQDNGAFHIGPQFWGRGNGWVMWAFSVGLQVTPADHPRRAALLAGFVRQAQALAMAQTSDGRWHTVVNHPETYVETSATALIGAALNEGVSAGLLPVSLKPAACAAALGTWAQVDADGKVTGVSAATAPLATPTLYQQVPNTDLQLYGQGAALLVVRPYAHCS